MRSLVILLLSSTAACATEGSTPSLLPLEPLTPSDPFPTTTGSYQAVYRVPASADLAAAATYPIDHVDWTVVGNAVTLHYDLPEGLVGGRIGVTFDGAITPAATTIDLTGAVGVGACVATTTLITCQETFANLGVLPISMAVVEQVAALEYPGPAADRVSVAVLFSSDPIGIVEIDLLAPVVEDNPDGGGGSDDHP